MSRWNPMLQNFDPPSRPHTVSIRTMRCERCGEDASGPTMTTTCPRYADADSDGWPDPDNEEPRP